MPYKDKKKRKEYMREYMKKYHVSPAGKEYFRKYFLKYMENPKNRNKKRQWDKIGARRRRLKGKINKTKEYKNYCKKNPEKVKAQQAVRRAIKSGKLKRSLCEVCGEKRVHAHHDNYDKALKVRWLCSIHHKQIHMLKAN